MFLKRTGRHTNTTARFPILFGLRFCNEMGLGALNVAGTGACFYPTILESCLSSTTSSIIRIEVGTQSTISILFAMSIMMNSTEKPRDRNEKASEHVAQSFIISEEKKVSVCIQDPSAPLALISRRE